MRLEHAIYGSVSGLGDYRILAASSGFDDRVRAKLLYYANIEGSALSIPFASIFGFFAVDDLWVFARTVHLGPTPRGNDYLVHAIVLDQAALSSLNYRVFALDDAKLFVADKPSSDSDLIPLELGLRRSSQAPPTQIDAPVVASYLRAIARGPVRFPVSSDADGAAVCRAIHESFPSSDRLRVTFCTRFSFGRNLDFRFAAFVPADESLVKEHAADSVEFLTSPPSYVSPPDFYDRWVAEMRAQADFDLFGVSILTDARDAFTLLSGVRRLQLWVEGKNVVAAADLPRLVRSARLVLHPENLQLTGSSGLKAVAMAVDLCERAGDALQKRQPLDECEQLCREMTPSDRLEALAAINLVSSPQVECWLAGVLLLLLDGSLEDIQAVVSRGDGVGTWLRQLHATDTQIYRAFVGIVLGQIRDRFATEGARAAVSVAATLEGDALRLFLLVMEATASSDVDRLRQVGWLLAIARDLRGRADLPPQVAARIILTHNLLPEFQTLDTSLGSALFGMTERLAAALTKTQSPGVYRSLVIAAHQQLRDAIPLGAGITDVLGRIIRSASELIASGGNADSSESLTALAFLIATSFPQEARTPLREAIVVAVENIVRGGVTGPQAQLLLKTLRVLGRGHVEGIGVSPSTVDALRKAVYGRRPSGYVWNRVRRLLWVRMLSRAER